MPFNPAPAGNPPRTPRLTSEPSRAIENIPTAPLAAFSEYRNRPSALIVMSRLTEPVGLAPTIVLPTGRSVPPASIEKPAIELVAAFDAYTKRPSGVITFQQFAAPSVGMLAVTG